MAAFLSPARTSPPLFLFLEQFNLMGRFSIESKQNAHSTEVSPRRLIVCFISLENRVEVLQQLAAKYAGCMRNSLSPTD